MSVQKKDLLILGVVAGLCLLAAPPEPPSEAAGESVDYVPGEVLVKFTQDATSDERLLLRFQHSAVVLRTFRIGAEHWRVSPTADIPDLVSRLRRETIIEYAHPNWLIQTGVIPNDPRFDQQWSVYNTGQIVGGTTGMVDKDIDGELAWDVNTGSQNVVVAVIDDGVDRLHPDLAANMWQNTAEVNGLAGVDDDTNGFIDDLYGWDFVNNDGDPSPLDPPQPGICQIVKPHGTRVAGVIAADANNSIGIAGAGWDVKIMALRAAANIAQGTDAVEYATDKRVDAINASWQCFNCTPPNTLSDAIKVAGDREIAFFAAAMNNGQNIDTNPVYPASYDVFNIIPVANTDQSDGLAATSNYGPATVDLGAPGSNIWTTTPRFNQVGEVPPCTNPNELADPYFLTGGTSFSSPLAAGVAALVRSLSPQIPVSLLKARILDNVDPNIPALVGKTVTGGRLNAFRAIDAQDTIAPSQITDLGASTSGGTSMNLTWTTTGDDGTVGTAALQQVRYSTANISDSSFYLASKAANVPAPAPAGTAQSMTVTGLSRGTCYHFAMKGFDEWGNGPLSNVKKCGTRPAACTVSYCKLVFEEPFRCTWDDTFGSCGCCEYTCVADETCTIPDPTPAYACGNYCQ